jgi:cellulose synthase/poly-beta-1,6-N-acetylglucosamine synthase-like glycosyltransferase
MERRELEMTAYVLLCTAVGVLTYIYIGYPVIVLLLAAARGEPVRRSAAFCPTVTVIITAYNEAESMCAKIAHVLSLSYPSDRLDVIVVSDASSDATDDIVRSCGNERVRLLRVEGRLGKTACQNAAASLAKGEILIYTDATTQLESGALRALVENFADSKVGCVAGLLVYRGKGENQTAAGGLSYWGYEVKLRLAESRLGTLIGVSGCLYAVRKSAYRPIAPFLISDFVIAMRMREQGLRTVLEPRAICFEETLDRPRSELAMRTRVAIRSISALVSERRFLSFFSDPLFAWQLWSHKLLRYSSPYWLILMLGACSALIETRVFLVMLIVQLGILVAGVAGSMLRYSLLSKPYYFLLTNLAALVATFRYLMGERMVTWQPVRSAKQT